MKDFQLKFYILEDRVPVLCLNGLEYIGWVINAKFTNEYVVAKETVGDCSISTVFIGMGYVLFETMIFGGTHNGYHTRCSTWDEAEAMHNDAYLLVVEDLLRPESTQNADDADEQWLKKLIGEK